MSRCSRKGGASSTTCTSTAGQVRRKRAPVIVFDDADVGRALKVARKLQHGCTWINTHFMPVNEMPHGGLKHSGYGKDMSMYALADYTVARHVMAKL